MAGQTDKNGTADGNAGGSFTPGDLVLVKITGYPWWPAMVVTTDHLTETALKARPTKGKSTVLGYPVQFLGDAMYSWPRVPDVKRLTIEDAQSWLSSGKKASAKGLRAAYQAAISAPSLDELKSAKRKFDAANAEAENEIDHQEENGDEEAELGDREAGAEDDVGVDEDAEDADDIDADSPVSKRKKTAKTSKVSKKIVKAKATASTPTRKTPSKRARIEDDLDEPDKLNVSTETGKSTGAPDCNVKDAWEKKKQHAMYYRHKLQKTLLSKDAPSAESMSEIPKFLQSLDELDVDTDIFRETKIGKVLSRIAKLESIPRDEELHIRSMVSSLLSKWQAISAAAAVPASSATHDDGGIAQSGTSPVAGVEVTKSEPAQDANQTRMHNGQAEEEPTDRGSGEGSPNDSQETKNPALGKD
ncbi:hypothetical protein PYCC9005_002890 [Savitreella phatthalungensis]